MKKILALALAIMMVLAMGAVAFASGDTEGGTTPATDTVKIEVTRDNSYEGTGDGNIYTWYKVFSASYASNTSSGGGSEDGAPGDVEETAENAAYTATSDVAEKLGSWVAATGTPGEDGYVAAHWQKIEGNLWFDLTPIAGTTNYSVKWVGGENPTADTVQAAAAWLVANEAYEATGTMTFADGKWSVADAEKGYYVIDGATGKNLIAATTDITIAEKNTYPGDDKTQADEDDTTQSDADRDVAVGDVLTYEVKVSIPATAKVGDKILVWDKASTGLTYNGDVAVKSGSNTGNATIGEVAAADQVADADWQKLITVTADSRGTDVVFAFTMTVNSDAIVDTGKENESGLKYGTGSGEKPFPYESTPDKVEYKTYYAGIHKIDGDTEEDLSGVKFALKEDGVAFNVTLVDGVYIPGGSSNEVVTDENGLIRIRGLDDDKTYTLTETETLPEYNMLDSDVTLTLSLDTTGTITYTPATEFNDTATYFTKDGDDYVEAHPTQAEFEAAQKGTYYLASANSASAFDESSSNEAWQLVENNKGALLPSTGGIGTTIFYVGGSILVLAAVVLLVTKRRMSAGE